MGRAFGAADDSEATAGGGEAESAGGEGDTGSDGGGSCLGGWECCGCCCCGCSLACMCLPILVSTIFLATCATCCMVGRCVGSIRIIAVIKVRRLSEYLPLFGIGSYLPARILPNSANRLTPSVVGLKGEERVHSS